MHLKLFISFLLYKLHKEQKNLTSKNITSWKRFSRNALFPICIRSYRWLNLSHDMVSSSFACISIQFNFFLTPTNFNKFANSRNNSSSRLWNLCQQESTYTIFRPITSISKPSSLLSPKITKFKKFAWLYFYCIFQETKQQKEIQRNYPYKVFYIVYPFQA